MFALLEPQILAQIVDRFGARVEPDSSESIRFPLQHCPARVYVRGSTAPGESVQLVDLASRSLGFTSQTRFLAQDALLIEFDVPGIPRQVWPCRVVRSQIVADGAYRIGACFVGPSA